ncbi:MAG: RNA polymerase sigma factor [Saprospiraceae bacterium]
MTKQEIIDGCRKQDPKYQKELVLRYSALLMATSRRYVPDRAYAKDILQEAFIKILKAFPKYEDLGSLEGWMKKVVVNTALSYFDKACFKREFHGYERMPEQSGAPKVYPQMAADELTDLINTLPDGFRTIFNLYAVEGYSHKEIGEVLGIEASTSRSQLTRARRLLVAQLSEKKKVRI